MDPETVISLFDSYWFKHEILTNKPIVSHAKTDKSELKFSSLRSILVRSQSDDIANSFNYGSFSPNSVLKTVPDLATKEQEHEVEQVTKVEEQDQTTKDENDHTKQVERKKNKKRRHGVSKSLSELEFEELKGFMDMGFVFSEQDKSSRLVEIIPGLQRLGEDEDDGEEYDGDDDEGERRPYLSEAWADWDRKMKKKECDKKVMKWEMPVVGDEVGMKDNLKLWAHTVASIVR
ncbi:hypothetical protein QVD17_15169 [Tagetes erecta]|uniref:Uncharacterized protein n=1 Tax=Tagetes erecta TaxID=13708 RepID=A0AAD8NSD8_TARER|nr:hypothetical protein QVD17_15169 [Tagetes erecta]